MAEHVVVAGMKGGTGKTTTALTLAAIALRDGKRVLLVDLDPQASASISLDVDEMESQAAALIVGHRFYASEICDGFDLISGGVDIDDAIGREHADVRQRLDGLGYDLIIYDTPPGHVAIDLLAIGAADVVLACAEAHRMAVAGAARVLGIALHREPSPPRACIVLGRVDLRRGLDKAAPEMLRGAYPDNPLFVVRQNSGLAGATHSGELPRASMRGWRDIASIYEWIIGGADDGQG